MFMIVVVRVECLWRGLRWMLIIVESDEASYTVLVFLVICHVWVSTRSEQFSQGTLTSFGAEGVPFGFP
jgi:hypothetical protein